jgi:hypothetical protein
VQALNSCIAEVSRRKRLPEPVVQAPTPRPTPILLRPEDQPKPIAPVPRSQQLKKPFLSFGEWIAILTLGVAVAGTIAAWLAVPGFQEWVKGAFPGSEDRNRPASKEVRGASTCPGSQSGTSKGSAHTQRAGVSELATKMNRKGR